MYGTLGYGFGFMMAMIFGGGGIVGAILLAIEGKFIQAGVVLVAGLAIAIPFARLDLNYFKEDQETPGGMEK